VGDSCWLVIGRVSGDKTLRQVPVFHRGMQNKEQQLLMTKTLVWWPFSKTGSDRLVPECILDFIRASGWWRWWWWQLELVRHVTSSSHITTNKPTVSFLQTDALLATQPTVSTLKGKYSTDLLTWGLPVLYLSTKGSWLLMGESCQASREPSDASTPVYSTFMANWSW